MITIEIINAIKAKHKDVYAIDYDVRDFGKKVYHVYLDDENDTMFEETEYSLHKYILAEDKNE